MKTNLWRVFEDDLDAYGITVPTFAPAVVAAEKKRRFELRSISPPGDCAVFYRDDSYNMSGPPEGPDADPTPPTILVDGGRWEVVSTTGKVLCDHDTADISYQGGWTWDGKRPVFDLSVDGRLSGKATLDPISGKLQPIQLPDRLPIGGRGYGIELSPMAARRAAQNWRQAPNRRPPEDVWARVRQLFITVAKEM